MGIFNEIFTWWNGNTIGTRWFTWRKGEYVGKDECGNIYYQERKGSRRWVVYNDLAEASTVTPEWHGWLHHTVKAPPTKTPSPQAAPWQKAARANMTGTVQAYRPEGSTLMSGQRPEATGDYEAWRPPE